MQPKGIRVGFSKSFAVEFKKSRELFKLRRRRSKDAELSSNDRIQNYEQNSSASEKPLDVLLPLHLLLRHLRRWHRQHQHQRRRRHQLQKHLRDFQMRLS